MVDMRKLIKSFREMKEAQIEENAATRWAKLSHEEKTNLKQKRYNAEYAKHVERYGHKKAHDIADKASNLFYLPGKIKHKTENDE